MEKKDQTGFDPKEFLDTEYAEFDPQAFLAEDEPAALPVEPEPEVPMSQQILAKLSKPLGGLEPFVAGASRALLPEFLSDPGMSDEEKKALEGFKIQQAPQSLSEEYYKGQQNFRSADEQFNKENPLSGMAIDVGAPFLSLPVGKAAGLASTAAKTKAGVDAAKAVGLGMGAAGLYGAGYSEAEPFREGKDFKEETGKLLSDMALPVAVGGAIPAVGHGTKALAKGIGGKFETIQDLLDIYEQGKKGKDVIGKSARSARTKESEEIADRMVKTLRTKNKESSDQIGKLLKDINDQKIPLSEGLKNIQSKLDALKQGATNDTLDIIKAVEGNLDKFKVSKEKIDVKEALNTYKDLASKEQQKASVMGESATAIKPKIDLPTRTVTGGIRKLNSTLEDVVSPLQVPIKSKEIKKFAQEASPEELYAVKRNLDELYGQALNKGASTKSVQETKDLIMDMIESELAKRDEALLNAFRKSREEMTNVAQLKESKNFPIGKAADAPQLDPAKYIQTPYQDAISDLGNKLKSSLSGQDKKAADLERFLSDYARVTGKPITEEVMDLARREALGSFGSDLVAPGAFSKLVGGAAQGLALGAETAGKSVRKYPAAGAKAGLGISALLNNTDTPQEQLMTPMQEPEMPLEELPFMQEEQPAPASELAPNEEIRYTRDGKPAIFDSTTRQFLRYADE